VSLFASGDSQTKAKLISVFAEACGLHGPANAGDEAYHEVAAFLRVGEFDVVHDHSWFGGYFGALVGSAVPIVTTLHQSGFPDGGRSHRLIGDRIKFVAVSEEQRRANPDVAWAATIHHGVDLDQHPVREDKDDYLVFVGRVIPQKGPELAVEAAKRAGRHLKMVVKCDEDFEIEHWDRHVAPVLTGDEEILLGAGHEAKVRCVAGAAGMLFPITWEEPFGLVAVEAAACGTPVIAMARGSAPELVDDGVTGFLVGSVDEMVAAVPKLAGLSPRTCRERAERMFSVDSMVGQYEKLFRSLVAREVLVR
jgi:glycosyltransferase involved in cell wall biosynthesis